MTFGLQFLNNNGDRVIDEDNEVMLVAEKGTFTGRRTVVFGGISGDSVTNDYGGTWIRRTHDGTASGRTLGWFTNIILDNTYSEKPILAMRGDDGTPALLPRAYVYRTSGTNFNAIRVVARTPVNIDWVLIARAGQAPASSKTTSGDYTLDVRDASGNTVFDARWPELFSVRDTVTFPVLSSTVNYISDGRPSSSVTIPSSPGAFFAIDGLYGHHSVREMVDQEAGFGAQLLLFGGGEFYPSVSQTSDTTLNLTMVNTEEGVNQGETGGDVVTTSFFQNTGGELLVIRYLNF